ncbi:hypothetical protein [Dactylosporangium maewongense]|uniref:hypothetical protein n=1 Tax=Dactylosporangium maewongense TaxID=634393 RepID=UPI0031D0388C
MQKLSFTSYLPGASPSTVASTPSRSATGSAAPSAYTSQLMRPVFGAMSTAFNATDVPVTVMAGVALGPPSPFTVPVTFPAGPDTPASSTSADRHPTSFPATGAVNEKSTVVYTPCTR